MTRCMGVGTLALVAVLCVAPIGGAVAGPPPAFPRPPAAGDDDVDVAIRDLLPFGLRGRGLPSPKWRDAGFASLCRTQQGDGRWEAGRDGRAFDLGATALAALAFLAGGVLPTDADDAGRALRRALDALVREQDADGCLGSREASQFVYVHAFGALALVEAFGMTGDPWLRTAAQRAVDFVLQARNPNGVWRYGVRSGANDTSVTGCMGAVVHAVRTVNRACEEAGIAPPLRYDEAAIDGIRTWIESITDRTTGRVGYQWVGTGGTRPPRADLNTFAYERSEALTGIGLFLRGVVGGEAARSPVQAKSVELLRKVPSRWHTATEALDLYGVFWNTHGLRFVGGKPWDLWRAALVPRLLAGQDPASGEWTVADPWEFIGGPTYLTAMALLTLFADGRYEWTPEDRRALVAAAAAASPPDVRKAALRALALRPVSGTAVVAVRALDASDVEVRRAGAAALVRSGRDADVPRLVAALGEVDDDVTASAALALGRLRAAAAVPGLVRALESRSVRTRCAALWSLGELGSGALPAVSSIERAVLDGSPAVGVEAVRAVRLVRGEGAVGLDRLIEALRSGDAFSKLRALDAIAAMGAAGGPAAGSVAGLLSTSAASEATRRGWTDLPIEVRQARARAEDAVGTAAATTLEALGAEARDVRLALETAALFGGSPREREAAKAALRRLEPTSTSFGASRSMKAVALPADAATLAALLRDPERAAALATASDDAKATALLIAVLADPEESVRVRAIEGLALVGPGAKDAGAPLVAAAAGADVRVAAAALRALPRLGLDLPSARDVVLASLGADDVAVRLAALDALAAWPKGLPGPIDALRKGARLDHPVLVLRTLRQSVRLGADEPHLMELAGATSLADPRLCGPLLDELLTTRPPTATTVSVLLTVGEQREIPEDSVRATRTALGQAARDDPKLRDAIVSRWRSVRSARGLTHAAMVALGKSAAPAAVERLRSNDRQDVRVAADLLDQLGPEAASVANAVVTNLRRSTVREELGVAIQLRRWFVETLGPAGRASLVAGLQSASDEVRGGTAEVMGAPDSRPVPEFAALLKRLIETEKSPEVRESMRDAIARNDG